MDGALLTWVIIPSLIFGARIVDVTMGTLRIILASKGVRAMASLAGFFEVLVWVVAITQIIQHLSNPLYYLTYAGGFAAGTYVGIVVEERLSIGRVIVRIITRREADRLVQDLVAAGYGITHMDADGSSGRVKIIYTIIDRHDLGDVVRLIKTRNPRAFYTIEDVRFVSEGVPVHTRPPRIDERIRAWRGFHVRK